MRVDLPPDNPYANVPELAKLYDKGKELIQKGSLLVESKNIAGAADCYRDDAVIQFCNLPPTQPTRASKENLLRWVFNMCENIEAHIKGVNLADGQIVSEFNQVCHFKDGTTEVLPIVVTIRGDSALLETGKIGDMVLAGDFSTILPKAVLYAGPVPEVW
ncbi:hypothetical protein FA15DRAFT_657122 [Coprinopsis marcescibilis]|uniref:Uncharacterized protein n=1 Tax=Coprinopsis marcescibilis TaxID=230819 RepID=A0A5C3KRQ5_COPMA|nr:hypothetical protein FA15DRAFT_657122 [Coprinopsis marcescibilis]